MRLTCTNKFRNKNGKIMYYEVMKDKKNQQFLQLKRAQITYDKLG